MRRSSSALLMRFIRCVGCILLIRVLSCDKKDKECININDSTFILETLGNICSISSSKMFDIGCLPSSFIYNAFSIDFNALLHNNKLTYSRFCSRNAWIISYILESNWYEEESYPGKNSSLPYVGGTDSHLDRYHWLLLISYSLYSLSLRTCSSNPNHRFPLSVLYHSNHFVGNSLRKFPYRTT